MKFIELTIRIDLKIYSNKPFFGFYKRKEKTTSLICKQEKYKCSKIKLNQFKVRRGNFVKFSEVHKRITL